MDNQEKKPSGAPKKRYYRPRPPKNGKPSSESRPNRENTVKTAPAEVKKPENHGRPFHKNNRGGQNRLNPSPEHKNARAEAEKPQGKVPAASARPQKQHRKHQESKANMPVRTLPSYMKPAVTVPRTDKPRVFRDDRGAKLRVFSLGGLQEIGKNMTVIEYGDDIVVIDCGMAFPDEELPGIDLVIPDVTYLKKNAEKVRGVLITHGHEDHVGAAAYLLHELRVPIYATALSLGIIHAKLEENPTDYEPELIAVEAGDTVALGNLRAEFIHVNHSIADACAIAVRTPAGTVFHTGDFKLDVSPIDGKVMDLTRIGEIGKEGVELLLCESTNAERPGFTPSERTVGSSLERIFHQYEDRRLIISTFSSNVHRVQQIIDASCKHGRKVAILGRSMVNVIGAATELGYMAFPDGVLVDVADLKKYRPNEITLITTGSQGEPMSALYRIAFSEHDKFRVAPGDVVVLSSSAIPGNEKYIGKIVNALVRVGVKVVNDSVEEVHVSGHACREELKLMMALLHPKYLMPIHGEDRHLYANKEIGEFMGIPANHIFLSEVGKVLEIDGKGARFSGTVPAGNVLVDGLGVGDIGSVVLRDRKHLAEDGLVVVVAGVNRSDGSVVSGPDIVSRGFVYVKESEELMANAKKIAQAALEDALASHAAGFTEMKDALKFELARYITKVTKRKPMILPIIMDM